jgi:hypothetical protein
MLCGTAMSSGRSAREQRIVERHDKPLGALSRAEQG